MAIFTARTQNVSSSILVSSLLDFRQPADCDDPTFEMTRLRALLSILNSLYVCSEQYRRILNACAIYLTYLFHFNNHSAIPVFE